MPLRLRFREWWLGDLRAERENAHGAVRPDDVLNQERVGQASVEQGRPVGLALSGGGIRSATFALGVIQSLSAEKKVASFDYLSTVSGGGYIGAWLSAWIHRSSLATVQKELAQSVAGAGGSPGEDEPHELKWLRSYSNYLTPRLGLLQLDSITLVAIYLRNFLLNLITFVAFVATLLMLPRLLLPLARAGADSSALCGGLAALLCFVTLFGIAVNLGASRRRENQNARATGPGMGDWAWLTTPGGVACTVIAPAWGAAMLGTSWWLGRLEFTLGSLPVGIAVVCALVFGAGLSLHDWRLGDSPGRLCLQLVGYVLVFIVGMAVAGAVLALIRTLWDPLHRGGGSYGIVALTEAVTFGPAAILAVAVVGTAVFVGLVGREYLERSREWWARLDAWLAVTALMWVTVSGLSFYGWPLMEFAAENAQWAQGLVGAGWIGSLFTVLFLRPEKSASDRTLRWRGVITNLAAWIGVLGMLFVTTAGVSHLFVAAARIKVEQVTVDGQSETPAGSCTIAWPISNDPVQAEVSVQPNQTTPIPLSAYVKARLGEFEKASVSPLFMDYSWFAFCCCVTVLLVFGWRVDVNEFSLHNLYMNRLIRCYLGASNKARTEHPFTGFEDGDDIPLKDLLIRQRPFHLLNATLNITYGRRLAWQERKAGSFVFTRSYCGYALGSTQVEESAPGAFQQTAYFGVENGKAPGITLGSALATSGAAVSPNRGYSSDPATAMLLTLFNVRLGRWIKNPRGPRHDKLNPRFGLLWYLLELLGFSNEERRYLYLSDGGHFDNLGIYELVRRECRLIVAIDATADPSRQFSDLGMAVERCRVDLGAEITIPLQALRPDAEGLTKDRFSRGAIRYRSGADGVFLYVKPTLCGTPDEPADIFAYAAQNPDFPHETTVNQWFGESQFESYRRLGLFIGTKLLKHPDSLIPDPPAGWSTT